MLSHHTYAYRKEDIPEGEHYAMLTFSSIWIPGDERSRTAPGHGYPEHSEPKVNYIVFPNREEWEKEITARSLRQSNDPFVPLHVKPAKVKLTATVSLEVSR